MGVRQKVFFVLTLVWMVVIFLFSGRTGVESTEDSYRVGMSVGRMVVPAFNDLSDEEQLAFARRVDHPIRKTAHAMEYAVLGVFIAGWVYDEAFKRAKSTLYAWLIVTVYAATDELHQLFVIGRSGQITDILLDSVGAFFGVLIMVCILYGISNRREKKMSKKSDIIGK